MKWCCGLRNAITFFTIFSKTITFIKNMSTLIQVFSWLFCGSLLCTLKHHTAYSWNINFNIAKMSPPQSSVTVCAESGRYLPSAGVKRVKGATVERKHTHTREACSLEVSQIKFTQLCGDFRAQVCMRRGDWSLWRSALKRLTPAVPTDWLLLLTLSAPAQAHPGLPGAGGPGLGRLGQSPEPPWGSCSDPFPSHSLK